MTLQLNHHFTVPELKFILIPFFHDVVNLSKPQAKIDLKKKLRSTLQRLKPKIQNRHNAVKFNMRKHGPFYEISYIVFS
jgi:hypothetical protein